MSRRGQSSTGPWRMLRCWAGQVATRLRGYRTPESLVARGARLGTNVYIGDRVIFDDGFLSLISVGDDAVICAGTRLLAHDASTKRSMGYTVIKPVQIGKRAYIGADSIILPGVTVGDDAVVGAGSVVTRDVKPGTVVAGNPAREIGTTEQLAAQRLKDMRSQDMLRASIDAGGDEVERERTIAERTSGPGFVK